GSGAQDVHVAGGGRARHGQLAVIDGVGGFDDRRALALALMTVSSVSGIRPQAIRSRSTEPGPTLASWSLSPTKINRVRGETERSSQASSGRSTIDASSTITASPGRNNSTG